MDELSRPVIIFGTGRSGTTIISSIIFRHRDLAYPSNYQEFFPGNTGINLVRRLFDNQLWRAFGQKRELNEVAALNKFIFKPGENYRMWDHITGPDIEFSRGFLIGQKAEEERAALIRQYFSRMVRNQGRKRLGLKITGPSRMEYLMSIFPDARFIQITRQIIPTINSFMKVGFWQDLGMNKLWWKGPYSEEEKEWVKANPDESMLITALQLQKVIEVTDMEIRKCNPEHLKVVSYEDFVEAPEDTILDLLGFLQLDKDDACLHFLEKHKIFRRNKPDDQYFSPQELERLNELLVNKRLVAAKQLF